MICKTITIGAKVNTLKIDTELGALHSKLKLLNINLNTHLETQFDIPIKKKFVWCTL